MSGSRLRAWRRRGKYAEISLVRMLKQHGYRAVRIPVSNPSAVSLPDVFASKEDEVFAFEVKTRKYYAYLRPAQVKKLFDFLAMIPVSQKLKHAIIAARFGKKWLFKELKSPPRKSMRICKRDKSNWEI
jgi:Holliday junction resolvase